MAPYRALSPTFPRLRRIERKPVRNDADDAAILIVESFDIPTSATSELRPGVREVKGRAQHGPCERHKSFHGSPIQRVIRTGESGERMPVHVVDGHTDGGDGVLYPISVGRCPMEARSYCDDGGNHALEGQNQGRPAFGDHGGICVGEEGEKEFRLHVTAEVIECVCDR